MGPLRPRDACQCPLGDGTEVLQEGLGAVEPAGAVLLALVPGDGPAGAVEFRVREGQDTRLDEPDQLARVT
ncbi:hypothetical protein IPZ70_20950 [Streptomyces polychromogenes]|nr:hypothetical protein [Streptomyces polychromogenes]